ncbi:MAG: DUF4249 domain-containing protein [Nitrososphaera sp.]|nr:DUF4249 domain-containing protein [Nitrososphaera sp.]MCI0705857.1 DUF4249 domain-containing protein [Ignavibacteriota bacterium]
MKYLSLSFIWLLFFLGCQGEINVDFPQHESKIVIEAYLTSGDSIVVRVSDTSPYQPGFGGGNSGGGQNAIVKVTISGTEYTLQQQPDQPGSSFRSRTLYSLPGSVVTVPSAGTITLNVEYQGQSASAVTTIPDQTNIVSFYPLPSVSSPPRFDIEIDAEFPVGTSYYFVQGFLEDTTDFGVLLLPFLSDIIQVTGNGTKTKVLVENWRRNSVAIPMSPIRYFLALKRINKELYDFDVALQAQLEDILSGGSLLGEELVEIPTNINGGVGIFAAMSIDTMSVFP